jgi:predicted deacylase
MRTPSRIAALLVSLALLLLALPGAAIAASPRFPDGQDAYHTYAEVGEELAALAAGHPDLVSVRSFGTSARGRTLWVVKLSDHVTADEAEPEVLVNALVHAREHLTVEQALALIRWLAEGHGSDPRVTRILDRTEIWVMPMVNPDGGEFDIKGGRYHRWRKNRQPNPGSTAIGTDLNRNFGYRWGCCGGSSPWPWGDLYRGSRAFSAVEARAVRRFVEGRVVGGAQQLRLALNLHSFGEQVLFPYGYTTQKRPPDMRRGDRTLLRNLALGVAARNGYRAMQESAMYVTDGTLLDWLYGAHRILNLTVELSPRTEQDGGFYPDASRIGALTERNRDAFLWFLEQAAVPVPGADAIPGSAAARESVRLRSRAAR